MEFKKDIRFQWYDYWLFILINIVKWLKLLVDIENNMKTMKLEDVLYYEESLRRVYGRNFIQKL
jgi:hypothetical protein